MYNLPVMEAVAGGPFILSLAAGFTLGSLPFSVWVGRAAGRVDVRAEGSKNPGAANVWRTVGRRYGILVGAADAAKGAIAVFFAGRLGVPPDLTVWAGAAAVAGHDFSPFLGFRGGKGGATTVGTLACFIFPELLAVLLLWAIAGLLDRRRRFLWSIVALSCCPLLAAAAGRAPLPWLSTLPQRAPSVVAAASLLVLLLWTRLAPGRSRFDG